MRYVKFDDFFFVLGNKQRVRILQYLNKEGPKNVTEIGEKLGVSQSAVSHNLNHLARCHFVEATQKGKTRIYGINKVTVGPLFRLIKRHVEKNCANGCKHWE